MKIISQQFLFSAYSKNKFIKFFFTTNLVITLFLSLFGLYGFFSGAGQMASLAGAFFLIVVALLGYNRSFRENPFSIVFCIFTFLFLSIPITFYLVDWQEYIFGVGLVDLPFSQEQYRESSPWGIIFLTLCWISIWLPITFVKPVIKGKFPHLISNIRISSILVVGALTWLITAIDRLEFAEVNMSGGTKTMGILSILFFVHAYLLFSGLVLILKSNQGYPLINTSVFAPTSLIFFAFLLLFTLEGSKGSTLSIFLLFMIYPISALRERRIEFVILPSPKLLLALAFLTLPIFYFVSVYRDLPNSQTGDFDTFYAVASTFNIESLQSLMVKILYRFSMAGFDRYMLIFESFGIGGYNLESAINFFLYCGKNFINLIFPGTPFTDAYMPSSQLFPEIIANKIIVGAATQYQLMNSFNTQAFTIFGLFIILFGLTAPLFLFIYSTIIVYIFYRLNSHLGKLVLIYFFSEILLCHGPEVVAFYSIQLFISMCFLYYISRFKISHALTFSN